MSERTDPHADSLPRYPPVDYQPLTISGGGFTEFGDLFRRLRRRWVKVEFQQAYDETGSEAFAAHLDGRHDQAAELVKRDVKAQWVYDHAREHGVEMTRIRVYEEPLTSYLALFEYHAYVADHEMGERLYAVARPRASDLIERSRASDFLVFDDWGVVALLYGDDGAVREARLVTDAPEVATYESLVGLLLERSEPLFGGRFEASAVERQAGG